MRRDFIRRFLLAAVFGFILFGVSGQKVSALSSYEQSLIRKVEDAFSEKRQIIFPDSLRHPVCATPLILEIRANWERMSPAARKLLTPYTTRPTYEDSEYTYDSPAGHFKIHYTKTGDAAVYQPDVDEDQDGVPDYVNECARILDHVWAKEVDTLGYNAPPSDSYYPPDWDNGGDGKYDVYLDELPTLFFGASYPEDQVEPGVPIFTSYLTLQNDYSYWVDEHPLYNNVYEPFSVTAAHEFFHAIHFGYDATEMEVEGDSVRPYWMEISAVWMEDMVYDDINDYLGYLPHFYDSPWVSLRTFDNPYDYHPYASCVWAFFLQENYGTEIIKKIWERCAQVPGDNVLAGTAEILGGPPYYTSFEEAFREFTVWNFFIGDRAIPELFYSEGELFVDRYGDPLEMVVERLHKKYPVPVSGPLSDDKPEDLGSNYLVFEPYADSTGGLAVNFEGYVTQEWKTSVVGHAPGFLPLSSEMQLDTLGAGTAQVYNWTNYSEIVIIPCVATKGGSISSYAYTYSADYDTSLHGVQLFPPWLTIDPRGPKMAYAGRTLRFNVIAKDQNPEDILVMSKQGVGQFDFTPSVSPAAGQFSWTPAQSDTLNSPYYLIFDVTDGNGGADTAIVEITVKARPQKDVVLQNFPNPFVIDEQRFTYFPLVLSEESEVEVLITTAAGEKIKSLKERLGAGAHGYNDRYLLPKWDGKNEKDEYVTSGIYLYHVKTKNSSVLKKLVVIR